MHIKIMAETALQSCFFVILHLIGTTMSTCEGPYLNLCGYYESEDNSTEELAETICDCQQVRFCYIIDLSQECDSTVVKLSTDGNITLSSLNCELLPLESGTRVPAYEFFNQTENEIVMNILTDSILGRYKISCSISELSVEFTTTTINEWDIVGVDPTEVIVDDEIQLKLTVVKQSGNSPTWCFVKTPDNSTEMFPTNWLSNTEIICMGFNPATPGIFKISLHSMMTSNLFDKSINVRVISRYPVALSAEYSLDFEILSIYFDNNIELHSSCIDVFSKESLESFGAGFNCHTRGNALIVRMGLEFQIVSNVFIKAENRICRGGSSLEFCLYAPSANLVVAKPKPLGPTLSLYTNPNCGTSSQKFISVNVTPAKYSSYFTPNRTMQSRTTGKTHRKNIMMWRTMRKIQNKFSSPLIIPQTNTTEALLLLENLSTLDDLDVKQSSMGSASVSIFVKSPPGSSSIVAEASVTFCRESKLYQHSWFVNKQNMYEDGKVLNVEDLAPGKYLVKCLAVGHNSSEVLGEGWTTTEILPKAQKPLIAPSEITAGTTDNISLHAITGNSIFWTCKTAFGKLCTTTDGKSVGDVLDLSTPNIFIPAGTFPVGDYVWTAINAQGVYSAGVFIKPDSTVAVRAVVPTVVIPSEEIVLRGSVRRAQNDCRAWWSSVREKGFSYLSLDSIREKEEVELQENDEVTLVIPPTSGNEEILQSDSVYMFKLQVFCPPNTINHNGSLDAIKVPLIVYNPPRVSPLVVEPVEGSAMVTNFSVSGGQADAADSFIYEWSYVDSCDEEIPVKRGAFGRNFTTFLPPGDIKLKLKVCNERGVCSVTTTPAISIAWEGEFPAENFKSTQNQIKFLLSTGDTLEAFGLAITVFKSLSLIHEPEFREIMFSTVGEGIKVRIKNLTKRLEFDTKAAKSSLKFFEQALRVTKYFRKGSDIPNRLNEFKDRILSVMNSEKLKDNL